MTKKERKVLEVIIDELQEKLINHNKNLTNKQLYCVEDSVEILKILAKDGGIDELIEAAKVYHKENK